VDKEKVIAVFKNRDGDSFVGKNATGKFSRKERWEVCMLSPWGNRTLPMSGEKNRARALWEGEKFREASSRVVSNSRKWVAGYSAGWFG